MKRICITYRMERTSVKSGIETAETCIVLPMMDRVAENILKNQERSQYISGICAVSEALKYISMMQGYSYAGFICAEEE